MKILAVPKHLSGAVAPLVILKYLVGLRIFEYPRGKLRIVPSLIYLLLMLSIFNMSILGQNNFRQHIKLLKLEHVLNKLIYYIGAIVITFEMILGYFYTKAVNACYRKITQIDETLRRLGSIINYGEIYFMSIGAVVIWFLYILFAVISTTVQLRADLLTQIWIIVAHVYAISISFSIIFEFLILVRYLQTRFKLVNGLLNENAAVSTTERMKLNLLATEDYAKITDKEQCQNIHSIKVLSQLNRQLQSRIQTSISGGRNLVRTRRSRLPPQIQKHFEMKFQSKSRNQFKDSILVRKLIMIAECRKHTHLLQTIRQVHLELCRILKTLCTSFGIQITLEIGLSIIYTTGLLYTLYIQLCEQRVTGFAMLDRLHIIIILTTTNVLKIVLINRVCKHATHEGKKTNEIIREIYGCCQDIDIREEIQQFDLQTSQNPVEFFIFGIFLNYQFLSSCLKTVTTYLVIMIQISISLESS